MPPVRRLARFLLCTLMLTLIAANGSGVLPTQAASLSQHSPTTPYPILFVTQPPIAQGFGGLVTTFGNHQATLSNVGRGGDLWIRYPDGTLKNLTAAAGYGIASGLQAGANAIAVREPAVHWSGAKAIFSMVMGAPTKQYDYAWQNVRWQLYEITGLGQQETPVITKVPNQPTAYNNISPTYGSDGRIIFTTDRPRIDAAHLYPQRDEYELAPTVTGIWSLDPMTGDLRLLNHAPSGDFTPIVDSYGRIVFTQWDHLQRDQQADADADDSLGDNQCNNTGNKYGTFNYSDESANATYDLTVRTEIFPEPRSCRQDLLAGTNLQGHTFNHFFPWTLNQDGTEGEVIGHLGRHELHGYMEATFKNDPNLVTFYTQLSRFNANSITNFFQVREDPLTAGRYIGVDAPEFGTHAAGQIIRLDAPPGVNGDQTAITYVTRRVQSSDPNHPGLFRDPLPLADGKLLAVHTANADQESGSGLNSSYAFRLKLLNQGNDSYYTAGQALTNGITKNVSYWSPDTLVSYNGPLWELYPVEVHARPTPPLTGHPLLAAPEQQMFDQAGVSMAALQAYLVQNDLALAVVRNVTSRDDFDLQQPYNLRVVTRDGQVGVQKVAKPGKLYDVTDLQFFQADQLRGWTGCCSAVPAPGRRVLAQTLHDPAALAINPANPGAPAGSLAIATDGSVAAFVPARRAMTWQMTDPAGNGVVRERYWITFQPGEVRVCTSCHGLNDKDQLGQGAPSNPPQALFQLLQHWQATTSNNPPPTAQPTAASTVAPTTPPTVAPTDAPTAVPTSVSTVAPTLAPTQTPLPPTATATMVVPTSTATPMPPTATVPPPTVTPIVEPTAGGVQSLVLQQGVNGYAGMVDTKLYNWDATTNYGNHESLETSAQRATTSLLRFDLGAIPVNSTVQTATLSLYLKYSDAGSQSRPAQLHRLLKSWSEMEANWQQRAASQAWSGAGPQVESDYADAFAATTQSGEAGVWLTWPIQELVQSWVSDPNGNLGVILLDPSAWGVPADSGYVRSYASSEHANTAWRPKLTIVYDPTQPPPPPTPTAVPTGPQTVVLQQGMNGYSGMVDAKVYSWDANTNYGTHESLETSTCCGTVSFLRFDLSSLPAGSTIQAAELSLYLKYSDAGSQSRPAQLQPLLTSWDESQVTWKQRATSQPWAGSGPKRGIDYSANVAVTTQSGKAGVWLTWPLKEWAQIWLNNPNSNQGVILLDPNGWGTPPDGGYVRSYASSEHSMLAWRPKLTITYTLPSAGNQSSTAALHFANEPVTEAYSAYLPLVQQ